MRNILKTTVAVSVVVAFFATAVLCCCVIKGALTPLTKSSCSHCASKAQQNSAGHECCFSKASPMEVAKNLTMPMPLTSLLALVLIGLLYIVPYPRVAIRSIYTNGPPGPVSVLPLYLQSRSLRI